MKHLKQIAAIAIMIFAIAACSKDYGYNNPAPGQQINATEISAAGDISGALTQFRNLLGNLNTTPGQTSGRREVNWDGVAATFTNNGNFPADFFNNTDSAGPNGRKRGIVYANAGVQFRVDSSAFAEVDPSYAATFKAFSPKKLIAPVSGNVTELIFKVPGTNNDATVKGFGLILSDVDYAGVTTVEYFEGNKSLGVFKVPARTDADGFSFLGVHFPDNEISRVKITAGNAALGAGVKDVSEGGTKDLVVLDDFIYSEPLIVH